MNSDPFICGVAEGFYGKPWSLTQRRRLFGWMQNWGLNTYLYAPKDDLKHRMRWRELYDETEAAELKNLISDCRSRDIKFLYALAPGLDFDRANPKDAPALFAKAKQLLNLGCENFAILYDDLDVTLASRMVEDPGSVAKEQAETANALLKILGSSNQSIKLIFCPTQYCARKAEPSVAQSPYLRKLGQELDPKIGFLWTGPEIVSETISVESIRELRGVIQRKPMLWDNIHANDYDLRRIYLGPYSGRPLELRAELAGILSNPNCEFEANFIPLRTLASYASAKNNYNPREAFKNALPEWHREWTTAGAAITLNEVEMLADCLYLPDQFGDGGNASISALTKLFCSSPNTDDSAKRTFQKFIADYDAFFQKMPTLLNRDLFYGLLRHAWELNEELQLLRIYLDWLQSKPADIKYFSPHFRSGIYRGGFVASLQRLLPMDSAGAFNHRLSLIEKNL